MRRFESTAWCSMPPGPLLLSSDAVHMWRVDLQLKPVAGLFGSSILPLGTRLRLLSVVIIGTFPAGTGICQEMFVDTPHASRQGILPSSSGLDHPHLRESARGPLSRSVAPLRRATRSRLPGGTEPVQKNNSERNYSVRKRCAPLRASTLSHRWRDIALAKHASAFTQGNDLPWNPAKHYSVLKVLNKLSEVYHIRCGLSTHETSGDSSPLLKQGAFALALGKKFPSGALQYRFTPIELTCGRLLVSLKGYCESFSKGNRWFIS